MAKLTPKQEKGIEDYIQKRYEEKTATRQTPSLPQDWTPPVAKSPLSREDARLVDKALRDMMKPLPQRD